MAMNNRDECQEVADALAEVRTTIREWRNAGVFEGDRGYQRLLDKEADLENTLNELYAEIV